jgi:light-regulated signal transduction histidine kinase (bacteriophytochrome)
MQINMDKNGQQIEWQIENLPMVFGDFSLLKQVWINLIDNALKYSRKKEISIIKIGYQDFKNHIQFYIQDNGVGFDIKYSNKLFGVFQRLHPASEFEGTGIGLANVQRIIHKHNGSVSAIAELNKGATFYFTLPKN